MGSAPEADYRLIAFDKTLMKPGCVLVQGLYGGETSIPSLYFDTKTWLLSPTPDMRLYKLTEEELKKLADAVNAASKEKKTE